MIVMEIPPGMLFPSLVARKPQEKVKKNPNFVSIFVVVVCWFNTKRKFKSVNFLNFVLFLVWLLRNLRKK